MATAFHINWFSRFPEAASNAMKHNSHDSDNTCSHRVASTAGTVVATEQLDVNPTNFPQLFEPLPNTSQTPMLAPTPTPSPPPLGIERPADFILTEDRFCGYISPEGQLCLKDLRDKNDKLVARHWFTCHAMHEVKDILRKTLDLKNATIINTEAKRRVAESYLVQCPLCKNPNVLYVRNDSVIRHLTDSCLIARCTKEVARSWTDSNMELCKRTGPILFSDRYETAAWRLYHAD